MDYFFGVTPFFVEERMDFGVTHIQKVLPAKNAVTFRMPRPGLCIFGRHGDATAVCCGNFSWDALIFTAFPSFSHC